MTHSQPLTHLFVSQMRERSISELTFGFSSLFSSLTGKGVACGMSLVVLLGNVQIER